jgi:hypothetical protein
VYNPAIIFFSSKKGVVSLPDKVELAEHFSSTFHTDDTIEDFALEWLSQDDCISGHINCYGE